MYFKISIILSILFGFSSSWAQSEDLLLDVALEKVITMSIEVLTDSHLNTEVVEISTDNASGWRNVRNPKISKSQINSEKDIMKRSKEIKKLKLKGFKVGRDLTTLTPDEISKLWKRLDTFYNKYQFDRIKENRKTYFIDKNREEFFERNGVRSMAANILSYLRVYQAIPLFEVNLLHETSANASYEYVLALSKLGHLPVKIANGMINLVESYEEKLSDSSTNPKDIKQEFARVSYVLDVLGNYNGDDAELKNKIDTLLNDMVLNVLSKKKVIKILLDNKSNKKTSVTTYSWAEGLPDRLSNNSYLAERFIEKITTYIGKRKVTSSYERLSRYLMGVGFTPKYGNKLHFTLSILLNTLYELNPIDAVKSFKEKMTDIFSIYKKGEEHSRYFEVLYLDNHFMDTIRKIKNGKHVKELLSFMEKNNPEHKSHLDFQNDNKTGVISDADYESDRRQSSKANMGYVKELRRNKFREFITSSVQNGKGLSKKGSCKSFFKGTGNILLFR